MKVARESLVHIAARICLDAHAGQTDRSGVPYWLHPFTVAEMVEGDDAKCVAYLHDVVEDTPYTLHMLRDLGLDGEVVQAVDCLTRRDGETYTEYIERVKGNRLARIVKIADLTHNLNPDRSHGLPDSLRGRYEKALAQLSA